MVGFLLLHKTIIVEIASLYKIYLQHPNVQTDTRKIKNGDLFFALKGPNFNGNAFAESAIAMGAAYAIVDEQEFVQSSQYIFVDDVLNTLQRLANHHRRQFDVPFLAITGSNGKTTSKELITAVLRQKGITYATIGNLNNHIGVPLTILSIKQDAEFAIIEMGANHQKEIESYCTIAEPNFAVINNCGKAHLEGFGGIEGVRKGKGELFDYIRENGGTIFRNTDLDYLAEMAAGIDYQITYGSNNADYSGSIASDKMMLQVLVNIAGETLEINSKLVGDYNFGNILLAVAVGAFFNVSNSQIKAAIEGFEPDNSRSQFVERGTNKIILDAYNANPTSMLAAINNFAKMQGSKQLWLGAMKEMGDDEVKEHANLVARIAENNWENVVLVGKEFEALKREYKWFESSDKAAEYIAQHLPKNTQILIKGSRGSKMEKLFDIL